MLSIFVINPIVTLLLAESVAHRQSDIDDGSMVDQSEFWTGIQGYLDPYREGVVDTYIAGGNQEETILVIVLVSLFMVQRTNFAPRTNVPIELIFNLEYPVVESG